MIVKNNKKKTKHIMFDQKRKRIFFNAYILACKIVRNFLFQNIKTTNLLPCFFLLFSIFFFSSLKHKLTLCVVVYLSITISINKDEFSDKLNFMEGNFMSI